MQVIKGKQVIAPKVMIYGLASAGKSSLAATLPDALFLDSEGGLSFLDVAKTPVDTSVTLLGDLGYLYNQAKAGKKEYKYIVIDSVDWVINMFVKRTTGVEGAESLKESLERVTLTLNKAQGGYGNGKQVLENYVRNTFLAFLDKLNREYGYGIILVAHADRKTLLDADGSNIERLAPKMDINSMNAFVEWTDNLFYLRSDDDGVRHLIVNPTDTVTAKNRMGLKQSEFIVDDKFNFEDLITGKLTKD